MSVSALDTKSQIGTSRRGWAVIAVAILVLLSGGAPGLSPSAGAAPAPTPPEPIPVTVAVHTLEPFVMYTGAGQLTGFSIDLWAEVAKRLNLDTEYLMVDDAQEQLAAVAEDRANVAVGALSVTSDRQDDFDFTQPILNAGLQIIVPVADTRPSVPGLGGYLDLLFSRTMLIWITAALVVSVIPAHVYWLTERRAAKPVVSRSYFPGIFESFAWGTGSLVGKNTIVPTRAVTRVLGILWGFAGIVFVAFYSANLSANLTVAKLDSKIAGPGDLYEKKVATVAHSTASEFLRDLGVAATETHDIEDAYQLLRAGGYHAVVYDAPVLRYYVTHRGQGVAVTSGPIFHKEALAFAFDAGDPLRKKASKALLEMREDGSFELIREKWFGDDVATTAGDIN